MPKPDSYNGIRLIPAGERITLPNGNFIGFLNGATAQDINIRGELVTRGLSAYSEHPNGITFRASANAYIPVNCNSLLPTSTDILGYL